MNLSASVAPWSGVVRGLSLLFPLHWQEVGIDVPLDINYRAYYQLEKSGGLIVVGLWKETEIVGYWSFFLSPFLHSQGVRVAHTDMLFIRKDCRSGGAFRLLYAEAHKTLLARGVKLWFVGEKNKKPLGKLLQRYGFVAEETSYMKRLGK